MRVAVISDIHGNCTALDAAMIDIQSRSVDKIVCLGDTIQGGPQPKETVQRLRGLNSPIVMGNADAWLLDVNANPTEPATREQLQVRSWTLSKLSSDDLDFIRGYKSTIRIQLDDSQTLLCFHGSPSSFDDILLPDTPREKWDQLLGPYSTIIMCGGHTHTQQVRKIGSGVFFNPGSIGFAYNYLLPKENYHLDPWAEYAILDWKRGNYHLDFHHVNFDLEKLANATRESGRPYGDQMIRDFAKGK